MKFAPNEEELAVFHQEVLGRSTEHLMSAFGCVLAQPGFMRCGGTAVALYLGHRQSDDLDLLTEHDFDSEDLLHVLGEKLPTVDVIDRRANT